MFTVIEANTIIRENVFVQNRSSFVHVNTMVLAIGW